VRLADGEQVPYGRLLIATGTRARQWPNPTEAALEGVYTLRSRDDAARLQQALAARPSRVLIIGAGFIGSEMASVCRELDIPVTVAERGSAPLVGALGGVIGRIAAEMQRESGVDLRTGVSVTSLNGNGRVQSATFSDGSTVDVDVVLVALGSARNVEWLEGSGLAAGPFGVGCDAGARAFDVNGVATDSIYVVGDVARAPHPLYEYQFLAMEHWDNAVLGADVAAHNIMTLEPERRPHLLIPGFWSGQFGVNIKSVGVPPFADEIVFTQGSPESRCFVAAYGRRGRIVAAVAFDQGKWLDYYAGLIAQSAPFPPPPPGWDRPAEMTPIPAEFPAAGVPTGLPEVVLTGHSPSDRRAEFRSRRR
jgi:3-phenylpropionate/trans-cinnamate dioxygenase ferredoxin reductase subunit